MKAASEMKGKWYISLISKRNIMKYPEKTSEAITKNVSRTYEKQCVFILKSTWQNY